MVLLEYIEINTYTIVFKEIKQLFYKFIYILGFIELETFYTYIKTNLANDFIYLFNSPTNASILFDKKSHKNLQICVSY